MAQPVISSRPDEWNAGGGNLPLLYEITNDKFPIPSGGTTIAFTSVDSLNGKARLVGVSLPGSISVDDYVYVNGSVYNGVFRVTGVGSLQVVINTDFISTDTGTVEQGYYNYKIEIDVYAGIPSGHPLNASQPIELVGTMSLVPDSNNTTYADIKAYVQKKLSTYNGAGDDNDFRLWSGFYVVVREIYDESYNVTTTSADVDDSSNTLYAVNATLQFQNSNGGNMVEYVMDTGLTGIKWLSSTGIVYFRQRAYWDFSALVNVDTFDLIVSQFDSSGTQIQQDTISYSGDGVGVYRFSLAGIIITDSTVNIEVVLQISSSDVSEILSVSVDSSLCLDGEIIEIGNFMLYEDGDIMLYEDGDKMLYEL